MVILDAVHILQLTDKGYVLNYNELEKILLADHVKDTYITIVSVAGAYRKGKSFLLNYILRYMESEYGANKTSNWLGDEDTELTGFGWRGGSERHTTGILMYPKVYQHTLFNGEKISILLVDTQGTFDDKSTLNDCVTIFSLSTIISTVQIYNIFYNIQEDDLQHLQLFTEYGKLAMKNNADNKQKPFQKLQFLIRDFAFSVQYGEGSAAGEKFLKQKLEIKDNQPKELKNLRKQINSCFDDISCFVMPFPGKAVQKEFFKGNLKNLDEDFIASLKEFIPLVVGPNTLKPKTINGQNIKAKDFIFYAAEFTEMFQNNKIPTALTLFEATIKANHMSAIEESKNAYNNYMKPICDDLKEYITMNDLLRNHEEAVKQASELFEAKTKIGRKKDRLTYHNLLKLEFDKYLNYFLAKNESKRSTNLTNMIENLQSEMSDTKNMNEEYQAKLSELTEKLIQMKKNSAIELKEVREQLINALKPPPKKSWNPCAVS